MFLSRLVYPSWLLPLYLCLQLEETDCLGFLIKLWFAGTKSTGGSTGAISPWNAGGDARTTTSDPLAHIHCFGRQLGVFGCLAAPWPGLHIESTTTEPHSSHVTQWRRTATLHFQVRLTWQLMIMIFWHAGNALPRNVFNDVPVDTR